MIWIKLQQKIFTIFTKINKSNNKNNKIKKLLEIVNKKFQKMLLLIAIQGKFLVFKFRFLIIDLK